MSNGLSYFYNFGEFRFDAEKLVLLKGDESVLLPPKATAVLSILLDNHGELVERRELIDTVWQNTFVEEGNLNQAISLLRKTLGSNSIIQTVPRRGYRFTAAVAKTSGARVREVMMEKRTVSETIIEEDLGRSESFSSRYATTTSWLMIATFVLSICLVAGIAMLLFAPSAVSTTATSSSKVLVILPLRSLGSINENKAMALAITESLASRLGSSGQIIVRPTGSSNWLAEFESDPIAIGKKLGADAVFDGSYLFDNDRMRVIARLLNVSDGQQIWSGSFDESTGDIFKLHESLSTLAAKELSRTLSRPLVPRNSSPGTESVEAYDHYVRGRYAWNKRTRESLLESVRLFQEAIDADPTFAKAYAGLADSYVILNDYDAALPEESYPKAKAAALKALEIDPSLVEPRVTLAYVLSNYDWNFVEAEREYLGAIEAAPNYATAHQWYGEMLYTLGRFEEAEPVVKRAAELDPLSPIMQSEIGVVMYYAGKTDAAIAHFAKQKNEYPDFAQNYLFSSWAYEQKNMPKDMFDDEIEFWRLNNVSDRILNEMRVAYQSGGRASLLRYLAEMLETASEDKYFREYRLVHVYGRLRDRENTLKWIEKGVQKRSAAITKILIDPNFNFLKSEPRYLAALEKMNLR